MEKIIFEYNDANDEYALESAWAEKKGEFYKLSNILFYATGYSWGDIVSVEDRNGELYVTDLIEESGHSTVRIIFYDKEIINATIEHLKNMGCGYEGSNIPTLISFDIPPNVDYKPIKEFLEEGEINEVWSYEEACLAHKVN
ncbi:DUF4265 domain-containing protein [Mucilaginibacter gotjawali]|uniref:Uncharacterized protein n=2 Tax=Mucilaginibacter gotjawali TaxID=1550579 RepID=A0A110B1W9_9SPHI|nr:DUF4265 domain-containing protein [Mucilaginibacter gotjawali]MBB3055586.1 hypothetical protein [Mucilaginibacter gotjawali]BAU53131.1 hypothetical protein MgSA37_01298 [Mucilaginibacter gotjawali]